MLVSLMYLGIFTHHVLRWERRTLPFLCPILKGSFFPIESLLCGDLSLKWLFVVLKKSILT